MADQRDDGGPAFPMPATWNPNGSLEHEEQYGMSLRGWFAGQALTGYLANPKNHLGFIPDDDAIYLGKLADAMLAERERGEG